MDVDLEGGRLERESLNPGSPQIPPRQKWGSQLKETCPSPGVRTALTKRNSEGEIKLHIRRPEIG